MSYGLDILPIKSVEGTAVEYLRARPWTSGSLLMCNHCGTFVFSCPCSMCILEHVFELLSRPFDRSSMTGIARDRMRFSVSNQFDRKNRSV